MNPFEQSRHNCGRCCSHKGEESDSDYPKVNVLCTMSNAQIHSLYWPYNKVLAAKQDEHLCIIMPGYLRGNQRLRLMFIYSIYSFQQNVRQKRGSCCPCPVAQTHHNTAHLSRSVQQHTGSLVQAAPTALQHAHCHTVVRCRLGTSCFILKCSSPLVSDHLPFPCVSPA